MSNAIQGPPESIHTSRYHVEWKLWGLNFALTVSTGCLPSTHVIIPTCISTLRNDGMTYAGFLTLRRPIITMARARISNRSSFRPMKRDARLSACARCWSNRESSDSRTHWRISASRITIKKMIREVEPRLNGYNARVRKSFKYSNSRRTNGDMKKGIQCSLIQQSLLNYDPTPKKIWRIHRPLCIKRSSIKKKMVQKSYQLIHSVIISQIFNLPQFF